MTQTAEVPKPDAADKAIEQIQVLCARAYKAGFSKGFEEGVACAMGMTPKESILPTDA